jgi:hypothetical protein
MRPGKLCGVFVPSKSCPYTLYFVCCNLLAVSRAPENNSESLNSRLLIVHYRKGCVDTKTRVVIERIVRSWSVIKHFVTKSAERLDKKMASF